MAPVRAEVEFVFKNDPNRQELVAVKTFMGIDQGISGAIAFLSVGEVT